MPLDLSRQILIDHHAHTLRDDFLHVDAIGLRQAFCESRSMLQLQEHLPHSINYMDFLGKIGQFLETNSEEKLLNFRERMGENELVNLLFDDASIGAIIIDDGFQPANQMSMSRFIGLSERPVFRCRRIESAIEDAVLQAETFEQMERIFPTLLLEPLPNLKTVALKTIAAYRGGLNIELVPRKDAEAEFAAQKQRLATGKPPRVSRSKLYHYLLLESFAIAKQNNLPVQIHSGTGDREQDLLLSNPACFRSVLESKRFAQTKFVFLHCYPYVREAAYLCSIYANVYMDISLTPFIASPAVQISFTEALAAAPATKILAATDGHSVPETYWYASLSLKRGLSATLNQLIDHDFIDNESAERVAAQVLHGTAKQLYALDGLK